MFLLTAEELVSNCGKFMMPYFLGLVKNPTTNRVARAPMPNQKTMVINLLAWVVLFQLFQPQKYEFQEGRERRKQTWREDSGEHAVGLP